MTEYFDELETRELSTRDSGLFSRLPELIKVIISTIPAWKTRLVGTTCEAITNREALSRAPILRKGELMQAQHETLSFLRLPNYVVL